MGFEVWVDLILFFALFALFAYIFATVTITNLHKLYLLFHFAMMLWPFCQFAIKTTENPTFQLFYVKLAFVSSPLLTTGWLLFTIFLTGQSKFLRRKVSLFLFVPALLAVLGVIVNPNGWFVLPVNGGYIQRAYGPIFWFNITILMIHFIVSLYIIYLALVSNNTPRIKKQVMHMLRGILVVAVFTMMDIFLNVILSQYLPVIPGMASLGVLLSAIIFVVAIHRDKVFDIVNIAHQDIIDTIEHGILVLDDNEIVVEINQSLLPHINLRIGDQFNMADIFPHGPTAGNIEWFLHTYRERPLERIEIELLHPRINRHISIHSAPIMVSGLMVGRIITFQDITELRRLIDETILQNKILQERNEALIKIQDELFQTNRKLNQMAITDSLTGCYNRHYLTQQLENEVMKNRKYQISFAILLLDIDFFKLVNDNYGHLAGDEVICNTVEVIRQTLRRTDILARYGGEEFIIYLPNTDESQAKLLAERIKSTVESNKVIIENIAHSVSITISMGLLSINDFSVENILNPKSYLNDLFESVDKALYQAKNEGRNRIISVVR
ncbi:diguanylate cyclase (GGDEF) domain-containing protein [Paenibacillus sophorae]|uniref:Diguanylate cyclase n=1 Tax=Paenibacillus sophorae TaxID=1333845 RepID=A0A1H8TF09_9BACL|nr:diguanylate cyclase [Paenibacillus sophorae]QWU16177.1 diguanylate cyclase [Paenibacillus sophorae]SEO89689.1 diguanylate cyclase (GGDEF) domain-containing protein [Paenibacillus sophorae]